MKILTLILISIFSGHTYCQDLKPYDLEPYNKDFNFKLIDDSEVVEKNDSLQAIIIVFKNQEYANARLSINNNPQLKEIKLFASNQDFLEFIAESKLKDLTHVFFERYRDSQLEIPSFPTIEHLTIQSSELVSLNMINSSLNKLDILDIETPKLTDWKTNSTYPELGLINLTAPLLDKFPIEKMPNISQFSYYCSFKELPLNLCEYKELLYISFCNYSPVQVDKCFLKKIKKGVYSDLTIYDKIDGKIISETLSKDRKE